ncbi:hypothetical protein McanMca71_006613 [Microsporum canis]|uniref:Uncharacterized protein n=1 Tax=Arthroderma otae (strain ATCC MYA-4605 / CBS 113480) TaxID=554155 RepID=C5FNL8_ARTOC|nr:conserved hypothetical protein [Microsporum canis CBS 113480]EEQ31721.1 conserved hypothetical protein [Microsporum canis CBS 113480]
MSSPSTGICGCEKSASSLASCLPSKGVFDFSILASINQPLNDHWKLVEACKHPLHNNGLIPTAINLSETIFCLCSAACTSYGLFDGDVAASIENDKIPIAMGPNDNGSASPSWRCSKSSMSLGRFIIHGEEESLLARQIVCVALTNLSTLLREMSSLDKDPADTLAMSSGPGNLYGRELDGQVSHALSRVLSLLGKISSE